MRRMRGVVGASAIVGLAVASALTVAPREATASVPTQRVVTIAPGLTLTKISDPSGPYSVRVLTIDPQAALTIDVATAGAIGSYARTSVQGSARGALAAINGDFTISPGRPLHPFAEDGSFRERGLQVGTSFAISADELSTYVDRAEVAVRAKDLSTGTSFAVAEWNSADPNGGTVAGYTPYGGSIRPPQRACSVRLKAAGPMRFGKDGVGVARDFEVVRARCSSTAMAVRAGTTVLSARRSGAGADLLRSVRRGHAVRLRWSLGWPGVMDSIGGMPHLVEDGTAVAPTSCDSYFCLRNPRTGIGVTADGRILLVTVDGRRASSVGMTLIGFARYMVDLGAVDAINLDGGGSTTMWVDGLGLVNDPSDPSGERPVTTSVLVLPGADPGEPVDLTAPRSGPSDARTVPLVSAWTARRTAALVAADAGSTGGLIDALVAGDLGPTGALPPAFLRIADRFR